MLKELAALESLESALGAAATGFVITDFDRPDNPIVYSNPAFSVMTGFDEDEIVGRNCRFLQGADTDTASIERLRQAIANGEEFEEEILNYQKNGTPFWNRLFVSPIRGVDDRVHGFVGVQEDVTRRRTAENQRENLIADLDEFASIVAHDLQAPLRHIKTFLEIIKEEQGDQFEGEVAEHFARVIGGADRASHMVQDTLKLARAGRSGTGMETVDLNETVSLVLEDLADDITKADARIDSPSLPHVRGHASELHRVFANLISNAIRYRSEERPCVALITSERRGERWHFAVSDQGIGVPEQSFDTVFRAFRRGSNVVHGTGTGIGLAVVKRIIEAHGGQISLRSQMDVGTTFEFDLPAVAPESGG